MTIKKLRATQRGFTLIELLVVIGIVIVLLAITIIALNPIKHFQDARNAQRESDVTTILDAIYEYEAANKGSLPTSINALTAGTVYDIRNTATAGSKVDLCANLVPTYVADLPLDPTTGTKTPSTGTCVGTTYATGYTITRSTSGTRFTIAAPSAENSLTISVTK